MKPIDPKNTDSRRLYNLMTSVITPRPIAWVSTLSRDGVLNLAPFSFFNGITSRPPLLSISVGRRRGARKDTANNASATGELVVNVVTEPLLERMVKTSGDYPPEVSEFDEAGVTPLASVIVEPPRVAEAPVQLECRTREIFEISPGIADLVIAEIVMVHLAEDLPIDDELIIDPRGLRTVARLGGRHYALQGELREIDRPKV
ncbi:MAG: flavin reductase family protein [Myxococcales bacterium]|nr:flavin reductase family protein [Myxococcales bacterium]